MRFRDKIDKVLSLDADIAIISECEAPVKGGFAHNVIWVGDNANKGLAVFSLSGKKIEAAPQYNDAFKYVLPIFLSAHPTRGSDIATTCLCSLRWSRQVVVGSMDGKWCFIAPLPVVNSAGIYFSLNLMGSV